MSEREEKKPLTEVSVKSNIRSVRVLVIVLMILTGLAVLGGMSSIASLLVYDIPWGTEYQNAHSYWALIPAVFSPLLVFAMAVGLFRNVKLGSYWFGFIYCLIHEAILITIFIVTMVDIFTCDAPDWWCYDSVTMAVSWRYWWYAASAWFQLLILTIWIPLFWLMHRNLTKALRSKSSVKSSSISGFGNAASINSAYDAYHHFSEPKPALN